MKKLWLVISMLICLFALIGCGEIKTAEEAVDWAEAQYDERFSLVGGYTEEGLGIYTLYSEPRDMFFDVRSETNEINIDGACFGKFESTSSDFFELITKRAEDQLNQLAETYHAELIYSDPEYSDYKILGITTNKPVAEAEKDLVKLVKEISNTLSLKSARVGRRYGMLDINSTAEPEGEWYTILGQRRVQIVDVIKSFYHGHSIPPETEDMVKEAIRRKEPDTGLLENRFRYETSAREEKLQENENFQHDIYWVFVSEDHLFTCRLCLEEYQEYLKTHGTISQREFEKLLELKIS